MFSVFTQRFTMRRRKAFTLIELLVVISIIALLISILLPALSAARKSAQEMTNNTRMRGIIQDMVAFAQDNNHYFPGVDGDTRSPYAALPVHGYINGAVSPNPFNGKAYRPAIMPGSFTEPNDVVWAIMLNHDLFAPKYLVSPGETSAKIQPVKGGTSASPQSVYLHNGSYAIECFTNPNDRGRLMEWKDNANSQAVEISDRSNNMFLGIEGAEKSYLKTASIWTSNDDPRIGSTQNPGLEKHWSGGIAWSDDHVVFSNTAQATATMFEHVSNPTGDNIFNNMPPLNETGSPPNSKNFGPYAYNAFMQYAGG